MSLRRMLHNATVSALLFLMVVVLIRAPLPVSERFETYVAFVLTEDFDVKRFNQGLRSFGSFTARWAWLDWLQGMARSLSGVEQDAVPVGGAPATSGARE